MKFVSALLFIFVIVADCLSADIGMSSNILTIDIGEQKEEAPVASTSVPNKSVEDVETTIEPSATEPKPEVSSDSKLEQRFIDLEWRLIDRESQIVTWWLTLVLVILAIITVVVGGFGSYALITTGSRRGEVEKIKDETKALALVADGNMLLAQKDYVNAEAKFSDAVKLRPDISVAYKNLGMTQINLEKFERAVENLTKHLNFEPTSSEGLAARGWAYSRLNKFELAEGDFFDALKFDELNAEIWAGIALVKFGKKEYREAIKYNEKSLDLNYDNAKAWNCLGISKQAFNWTADDKDGLYSSEEIIQNLEKAIALDPTEANAHNNIGLEFEKIGEREKALEHYSNAIVLKPDYEAAIKHRAQLHFLMENFEEAEVDIRRVLSLEPKNPDLMQILADILNVRGELEEALDLSKKALEKDPKQKRVRVNHAVLLITQEKIEMAIDMLLKGIEESGIHQDYIAILERIGREQFEEKNYDLVIVALRPLVDRIGLDDGWGGLISASYNNLEKYDEAIEFLDKCIKKHPKHTPCYSDRGHALHQVGRYEEAIRDRRYVLENGGEGVYFHTSLADSLICLGELDEAQAVIDNVIRINEEERNEDKRFTAGMFINGVIHQLSGARDKIKD